MVGVGRTVFSGTELEDFKVHVLGVMRNVIGPKRSLILARLEGGPLAKTGVIAGMSGSPVYVDGRLMGAVSYSLGQFSTEPIAGITPIAEMLDATMMARAGARARGRSSLSWPATPRELLDIWARDLGRARPFVDDPSQALVVSGGVRRSHAHERDAAADRRADDRVRVRRVGDRSVLADVRRPPASCRCRARSRPAPASRPPTRSSAAAR